jgi:hypothetical protein
MLIDFIKILIEQPEKIKKLGFLLAKFVLNLIFASKLYLWIIGSYQILNIREFTAWIEFIMTGRILICILLYVVSNFILFDLLQTISTVLLDWLSNKLFPFNQFDRNSKDFFLKVLVFFDLISLDEKTKRIKAGKRIEELYEFALIINQKEAKSEFASLKNTLIKEAWQTYLVFVLIYFFYLNASTNNNFLLWLILGGLVFISFLYFVVSWFLEFLSANAKGILWEVQALRFSQFILDALKDIGIYVLNTNNRKELGYEKYIYHQNKETIIEFLFSKRPLTEFFIKNFKSTIMKVDKKMILITNKELTRSAIELSNEIKNSLFIIVFKDEDDLVTKLNEYFKE